MTRDDIIRMAQEAGAQPSHNPELWDIWNISDQAFARFAALVAAAEREACAKAAEDMCEYGKPYSAAAAIRARGHDA